MLQLHQTNWQQQWFTWLFCCHGDHDPVGSCSSLSCYWKLLCHLPHQQHHIVLAHHWNTSISCHFEITPLSLLAFLYFQVLKGHDDHVITCLQFCGNRIVSGSDDNTLKVWSAVTGKVSFFIFFYLKDLIEVIIYWYYISIYNDIDNI